LSDHVITDRRPVVAISRLSLSAILSERDGECAGDLPFLTDMKLVVVLHRNDDALLLRWHQELSMTADESAQAHGPSSYLRVKKMLQRDFELGGAFGGARSDSGDVLPSFDHITWL
jgi:hypothetical protein